MEELQRAVEASLATASPLARRIYANQRWTATSVQQFINRVIGATIATVRADGKPHAAVVLAACLDGTIYFTASPRSALLGNLRRQSAVALTFTDPDHDATMAGDARLVGRASEVPDLIGDLRRLSRRGQFTPPDWDGYLYAVRVERIFLSS